MIYESNYTDRMVYSNARAAIAAAGVKQVVADNCVLTTGYLRCIQPILTGAQIINFPVLNNQTGAGNPTRPDEVRLPQQNAFFVAGWMFSIFKSAAYNVVPGYYPNSITYTNSANLYTLYNGRLNVTIDQSVLTRAYSMRKFLNIPAGQLTGATNTIQDQFDGTLYIPAEPNIVFVGTSQIDINVIMPASLGTIDANVYGCWDFFGCEAQNVALGAIQ